MNRLKTVEVTGRKHTDEIAYQQSDRTFNISASTQKTTYSHGESLRLSCAVENGSQDISYKWRIINSKGEELILTDHDNPQLQQVIDDYGDMTAVCTVTDNILNISESSSVQFTIEPQNITLSDISYSDGSATATLNCTHPLTVTFRVMLSASPGSYHLIIDGTDHAAAVGSDELLSVPLSGGAHAVHLCFADETTEGEVIIYILSVNGMHGETCTHEGLSISRQRL